MRRYFPFLDKENKGQRSSKFSAHHETAFTCKLTNKTEHKVNNSLLSCAVLYLFPDINLTWFLTTALKSRFTNDKTEVLKASAAQGNKTRQWSSFLCSTSLCFLHIAQHSF